MFVKTVLLRCGYPLITLIGGLLKIREERIVPAFIRINNRLVLGHIKKAPEKVMLLMPHCLQFSDCEYRVTGKEIRCRKCGKCEIMELIEIAEKYRVKLSIASGGTMARNIIKEFAPDLIIATACERDLISGLRDTTKLPVIGILNERPKGPCNETRVDIRKIVEILTKFGKEPR